MRAFILGLCVWSSLLHADRRGLERVLPRVRVLQDHAESAYRATRVMTNATIDRVIKVTDQAYTLMRDIAADPDLSEDERGRLYEEILRGSRGNDTRGSLARVFWSSLTHHGADDVDDIRNDDSGFRLFKQTLLEVFIDLKSVTTFRRDADGTKIWTALDRRNRERVARALTVRMTDVLLMLRVTETRSDWALDQAFDGVSVMAAAAARVRRERVVAERLAATFYAGMVVMNVFGAFALPFVQFDWIGVVTGGAWGSPLLSGASFMSMYVVASLTKFFTGTAKTHALLGELARLAADPGDGAQDQARYQEFRRQIVDGESRLGRHRRRMMARGYQADDPASMSCEGRLATAFL